jgi:hypothetical protein
MAWPARIISAAPAAYKYLRCRVPEARAPLLPFPVRSRAPSETLTLTSAGPASSRFAAGEPPRPSSTPPPEPR